MSHKMAKQMLSSVMCGGTINFPCNRSRSYWQHSKETYLSTWLDGGGSSSSSSSSRRRRRRRSRSRSRSNSSSRCSSSSCSSSSSSSSRKRKKEYSTKVGEEVGGWWESSCEIHREVGSEIVDWGGETGVLVASSQRRDVTWVQRRLWL